MCSHQYIKNNNPYLDNTMSLPGIGSRIASSVNSHFTYYLTAKSVSCGMNKIHHVYVCVFVRYFSFLN